MKRFTKLIKEFGHQLEVLGRGGGGEGGRKGVFTGMYINGIGEQHCNLY